MKCADPKRGSFKHGRPLEGEGRADDQRQGGIMAALLDVSTPGSLRPLTITLIH